MLWLPTSSCVRILTLWLISLTVLSTAAFAQQIEEIQPLQANIYQSIRSATPAIVEISRRGSSFSGVIVSPQGHVLTAGHTVNPGQSYQLALPDGRRFQGIAQGACEQLDGEQVDCGLIMISDPMDLPFVPLGSSETVQAKQVCLSISYPGGQRAAQNPTVRLGLIRRPIRSGRMIQSSALMEPGDSGGPLLDLQGRLIGIHSRIGTQASQNYDVPIDVFKAYWDALNVPQFFSVYRGQAVPKLGFVGYDAPDDAGVVLSEVMPGGIAQEVGLEPEDLIVSIHEQKLSSLKDLRPSLLKAIQSRPEQIQLTVVRAGREMALPLTGDRLILPFATRLPGMEPDSQTGNDLRSSLYHPADSSGQLEPLVDQIAELEDRLDDLMCVITSEIAGKPVSIFGSLIEGTPWILSKSSMIGGQPYLASQLDPVDLQVISRDAEHDLILLRGPVVHAMGVNLNIDSKLGLKRLSSSGSPGQLLITPEPKGSGWISVTGSEEFSSPRQESRGYLGVVLRDSRQRGVELFQVDDGAARRAGMQVGDVIVQIADQPVRRREQVFEFLRSVDPDTNVQIRLLRQQTEMTVDVMLGSPPTESGHAADLIRKSTRRDGFPRVFTHDAPLLPESCGGPVFDLEGNFVGINAARHSRVRTYVIPKSVLVDFVRDLAPQ
jgi:S1-C subfamily serine protease